MLLRQKGRVWKGYVLIGCPLCHICKSLFRRKFSGGGLAPTHPPPRPAHCCISWARCWNYPNEKQAGCQGGLNKHWSGRGFSLKHGSLLPECEIETVASLAQLCHLRCRETAEQLGGLREVNAGIKRMFLQIQKHHMKSTLTHTHTYTQFCKKLRLRPILGSFMYKSQLSEFWEEWLMLQPDKLVVVVEWEKDVWMKASNHVSLVMSSEKDAWCEVVVSRVSSSSLSATYKVSWGNPRLHWHMWCERKPLFRLSSQILAWNLLLEL